MATYKSEVPAPAVRGGAVEAAAALALLARAAAAVGAAGRTRAGAGVVANLLLRLRGARARWASGRPASTAVGRCRRSRAHRSADGSPSRGRLRRPTHGDRSSPTPSPTPSTRGRRGAVRVLEDGRLRACGCPTSRLCCGLTWITTGQLDAGAPILGGPSPRSLPLRAPACRSWARALVHGRVAQRRLELLRRRGRRARSPRRPYPRRAAGRTPGWAPPDLSGSARSPNPTATTTPSWVGRPTPRCCARPGATCSASAAAAGWPATSASSSATTTSRSPSPRQQLCRPSRLPRRRGPGRRLLLPHPARRPRRASGVHLAQLLARHLSC